MGGTDPSCPMEFGATGLGDVKFKNRRARLFAPSSPHRARGADERHDWPDPCAPLVSHAVLCAVFRDVTWPGGCFGCFSGLGLWGLGFHSEFVGCTDGLGQLYLDRVFAHTLLKWALCSGNIILGRIIVRCMSRTTVSMSVVSVFSRTCTYVSIASEVCRART